MPFYADTIQEVLVLEKPGENSSPEFDRAEATHIKAPSLKRKRHGINLFNRTDGINRRIDIPGHTQKQLNKGGWCALCGMKSGGRGGFRNYLSSFKCTNCVVVICVRTHSGMRRSCWDIWHSVKRLEKH